MSVYPGEIVKNYFFIEKKLLHCHPGDLPFLKVVQQFIIL